MALMERVATLLRANLNDLLDRAEDPEKVMRQLVMDMRNQLLQVKTQVAIALTEQHLLEKRVGEQEAAAADWHAKAERAVNKGDDTLARAALERAVSFERALDALRVQVSLQASEAEAVRSSYMKLQGKLAETEARCDLLIAEHRRARLMRQAAAARPDSADERERSDATDAASEEVRNTATIEERLQQMEREDRVEELLADLKSRRGRLLPTA